MCGNGPGTFITTAMTAPRPMAEHGRDKAPITCCAADRGTAIRRTCAQPYATATRPRSVSVSSGFAWPENYPDANCPGTCLAVARRFRVIAVQPHEEEWTYRMTPWQTPPTRSS